MTKALPFQTIQALMIGKTGAGKTAILRRLLQDTFNDSEQPSVGIDFFTQNYTNDPSNLTKMNLYDCSGKPNYLSLIQPYYATSKAAIICVPPTESIGSELERQIDGLKNANPHIMIRIVSTKADLLEDAEREVPAQLIDNVENLKKFADDNGYVFNQVSAKTGSGVKELFQDIATKTINSTIATPVSPAQPIIEDNFIDNSLNELIRRIERLNQGSKEAAAFQQALLQLTQVLEQKDRFTHIHMINTIVFATNKLLDDINQVEDKEAIKAMFKTYRDDCPTQSASLLKKLVRTVIITGIFMVVGATLAAGICLSLGLGLGVGAGIVASAGAAGLLSSGITFFRKNDIEKTLEDVVKTGKKLVTIGTNLI